MLLALELLLVPTFLLALSLIGARFGPSVAGWLAGLPLVAGPILFVLTLEQGSAFAAQAAIAAAGAVLASVGFCVAYARISQRYPWPLALAAGLLVWLACALLFVALPSHALISLALALAALLIAPRFFPAPSRDIGATPVTAAALLTRMGAGAALTLAVSTAANSLGSSGSGLLAMFPVLSTVLAVSSHRAGGGTHTAAVLRALAIGLYSFTAFCLVLAATLNALPVALAFGLAVMACVAVQAGTRRFLARH